MATTLIILPVQVSQEAEGRWEPQASVLSGFLMCLGVFPQNVILKSSHPYCEGSRHNLLALLAVP